MNHYSEEAKIFTRYLVGRDVSSRSAQIYKTATQNNTPDSPDKKLLSFMVRHPKSIGFIDAGLVFHNPSSEARRRLYLMLAILEAGTENHDLFLPKKRNPFYVFVIFYSCVRAVAKAGLGLILVKAVV